MFKIGAKKTFRLFGTTWTIYLQRKVESHQEDKHWIFGHSSIMSRAIRVSVNDKNDVPLPSETIKTTALHELVHTILTSGQYLEATQDEPMVEWIARSLQSLYEQKVLQYILDEK